MPSSSSGAGTNIEQDTHKLSLWVRFNCTRKNRVTVATVSWLPTLNLVRRNTGAAPTARKLMRTVEGGGGGGVEDDEVGVCAIAIADEA